MTEIGKALEKFPMISKFRLVAYDPKFSDTVPLAKAIGKMRKMEHFEVYLNQKYLNLDIFMLTVAVENHQSKKWLNWEIN